MPGAEVLTDDEILRLIAHRRRAPGHQDRPVDRRGAAAAQEPGVLVADIAALSPGAGDRADHQRHRPGRRGRRRWPQPGSIGSTSRWTPSTRRPSSSSPGGPGSPTCWPGSPRPVAAGLRPVKINTVLLRGVNDHEASSAALGDERRRAAAVHRADAAGRPARLAADEMITADEIRDAAGRARRRWWRTPDDAVTRRQRAGRAVPGRRRPTTGRHHRLGVASRSAVPATGSGSPPTGSSATACSPGPSPTCAHRCGAGPATPRSPTSGCAPSPASSPATASTTRASCSPIGPCRPSADGQDARASVGKGGDDRRCGGASAGACSSRQRPARSVADGLPCRMLRRDRHGWSAVRHVAQEAAGDRNGSATRGARRTPASACAGPGCGSSGCSTGGRTRPRAAACAEQTRPSGPVGSGSMPRSSGCWSGDPVARSSSVHRSRR